MRTILLLLAAGLLASSPAFAAEPAEVMIVGTVHLSNANQDKMNVAVDDVLTEKRQAELAAINDALMRFKPTAVAVEWPGDLAAERYAAFLAGSLEPSRNEVVQIGFRLAKSAGLASVHGIDVDGEFPFEAVEAYAKAHGQQALLDDAFATLERIVAGIQAKVDGGTLGGTLRYLNEPERLYADNGFYRNLLRVGGGAEQPGALLLAAWQKRNLMTCALLLQLAKPGDRVVVLFGSGHAFLLRQCVSETPGLTLVEANEFLPE
jgi:hypothetical protein